MFKNKEITWVRFNTCLVGVNQNGECVANVIFKNQLFLPEAYGKMFPEVRTEQQAITFLEGMIKC